MQYNLNKMKQSVSVFGLGYVGSVTAACLAKKDHRVIGVDVNRTKVETLESGHSPIVEAQVEELVVEGHNSCRLHATTDASAAVQSTDISFVCVGTPNLRNGKLDLGGIERVCRQIGEALRTKDAFHWVVVRSTVLPGTTESVVIPTLESASGKRAGQDFGVSFHPEFLREGTAVADFFDPPYVIFGTREARPSVQLRELYQWSSARLYETTLTVAEMVKYMCNAFHALKVGFANEVGTLCKELGVDTQAVTEIFASDTRLNISSAYLKPGFAFGGSCLPKDLRALAYRAKELDLQLPLLNAILPSNVEHIERAADAVLRTRKRKVGFLGLSFKAGTDDLRESPLVHLAKRLLSEGCQIQIWDEQVAFGRLIGSNRQFIDEVIPHIGSLLCANFEETVGNADVIVLGTRAVGRERLAACLRPEQIVLDLVHLEKEGRVETAAGYEGICWKR